MRSNYTYYFRAFAINKNGISYGNEVIVKTIVSKGSGYVSDIDGNVYSTINIGDQVWMADNLKTSRYANGDLIPQTKSNEKWAILESGSWCNYNNLIMYDKIYGKLYNWFTVSDSRNVCPIDWHVPSDIEWLKLTDSLGGVDFAGGKMKTIGSSKWQSPNSNATNESGFSALPGGDRRSNGEFAYIGNFVSWWCASEDGISNALFRYIGHKDGIIYKSSVNKLNGFSIRCIKD